MGLFDKIKEPVFMKANSNAIAQLNELQAYMNIAPASIQSQIENDIRFLKAGIIGEENIDFELRNSHMPMIVLHDLYYQYGDLSAQIDYLIVTRKLIFVVECKNLIGDIEINNRGEFIRTIDYNGKKKKEGIYSPITQNQHHMEIIKKVRTESRSNFITKAIFEKFFDDNYRPIVVLANPKTVLNAKYAKSDIKNKIIRADQLVAYIKYCNNESRMEYMSEQQMEEIGLFFLERNEINPIDYIEKYRIQAKQLEEERMKIQDIRKPDIQKNSKGIQTKNNKQDQATEEKQVYKGLVCPKCGSPMVKRVATKGANQGKEFYGCSNFPKCRFIININQD